MGKPISTNSEFIWHRSVSLTMTLHGVRPWEMTVNSTDMAPALSCRTSILEREKYSVTTDIQWILYLLLRYRLWRKKRLLWGNGRAAGMTQARGREKASSRNQCVDHSLKDDSTRRWVGRGGKRRERPSHSCAEVTQGDATWQFQRLKRDQCDQSTEDKGEMRPVKNKLETLCLREQGEKGRLKKGNGNCSFSPSP